MERLVVPSIAEHLVPAIRIETACLVTNFDGHVDVIVLDISDTRVLH